MSSSEIIIGLLTASVLIFIRSANQNAHQQKLTAVRLNSYLNYWKSVILENDWFNVFYVGVEWNNSIREVVKNGGRPEDLLELEKERKNKIEELKKAIESGDPDVNIENKKIIENFQKMPEQVLANLIEFAQISQQNLYEGKTFISDKEASYLNPLIAQVCISMKMRLATLQSSVCTLVIRVANDGEDFEAKSYAKEIADLTWSAILISKDIDTLSTNVESYLNKSILTLTLDNAGL